MFIYGFSEKSEAPSIGSKESKGSRASKASKESTEEKEIVSEKKKDLVSSESLSGKYEYIK